MGSCGLCGWVVPEREQYLATAAGGAVLSHHGSWVSVFGRHACQEARRVLID
jgi:hypothetical protein